MISSVMFTYITDFSYVQNSFMHHGNVLLYWNLCYQLVTAYRKKCLSEQVKQYFYSFKVWKKVYNFSAWKCMEKGHFSRLLTFDMHSENIILIHKVDNLTFMSTTIVPIFDLSKSFGKVSSGESLEKVINLYSKLHGYPC